MTKTRKQIENCLDSELSLMIHDVKNGKLTEQDAYYYFSVFLLDAGVDSEIVVNVLEQSKYGEAGKNQARSIKVNEGW